MNERERERDAARPRRRWVWGVMVVALAASSWGWVASAQARNGEPSAGTVSASAISGASAERVGSRLAPPSGCTTDCAIQSVSNGAFVSVEMNFGGDRAGVLRARAGQPRGWESFTIIGDCSTGCWIKSNANGKWLFPDWGSRVLRASLGQQSGNSLFRTRGDCTSFEGCTIRPFVPGLYLAADLNGVGNDYGVIRSADWWLPTAQRFRIVPVSAPFPPSVVGCADGCAIQSVRTGAFVTQTDAAGGNLAAVATTVGPRQTFGILGDCGPSSACGLRSASNGHFVSVEINEPGSAASILRARATVLSGWESFGVIGDCTSANGCLLQSRANRRLVVVTPSEAGSVLRATASTTAGADRFRITPVSQLAPTGIASASMYSCAINSGGTVSCWGSPLLTGITANAVPLDEPTPVAGVIGATAIDTNDLQACAVGAGGAVSCWGGPQYGNPDGSLTALPTGVTGATAVAVGNEHVCAILANGSVVCWDGGTAGQLGVTLPDGQLFSTTPVTVPGVTGAVAIAAGDYHTCALLTGGTVTCWGENVDGELGIAPGTVVSGPVTVPGIAGATAISAHDRGACALVAGTPRCWGTGLAAQLTMAQEIITPNDPYPTVFGTTKASQLTSNDDVVCVVLVGGAVQCTGFLSGRLIDTPALETSRDTNPVKGVSGATAVAVGAEHVCARSSDRSVRCWGLDTWGQLGPAAAADQPPLQPVVVPVP